MKKLKNIKYSKFKLQSYLQSNHLTNYQKQVIFSLRTNTFKVKTNLRRLHLNIYYVDSVIIVMKHRNTFLRSAQRQRERCSLINIILFFKNLKLSWILPGVSVKLQIFGMFIWIISRSSNLAFLIVIDCLLFTV